MFFMALTFDLWHLSEDGKMVLQVHLNSDLYPAPGRKVGTYMV
jgi:hypothetical protein